MQFLATHPFCKK